jgi:hypothetical protein
VVVEQVQPVVIQQPLMLVLMVVKASGLTLLVLPFNEVVVAGEAQEALQLAALVELEGEEMALLRILVLALTEPLFWVVAVVAVRLRLEMAAQAALVLSSYEYLILLRQSSLVV